MLPLCQADIMAWHNFANKPWRQYAKTAFRIFDLSGDWNSERELSPGKEGERALSGLRVAR